MEMACIQSFRFVLRCRAVVFAVHLCLQNTATWHNRLRLQSRACRFMLSLTAKTYSGAGQATSALHAMAISTGFRPESRDGHGTTACIVRLSQRSISARSALGFLWAGVPFEQVPRRVVVTTDASKSGRGAICNGHAASGSRTGPRLS